ncbi:hypothetical protein M408DRAFT_328069 [Serendipita vermifera MAFF 305830]|uniref:Uncharacterized protein n=1 Tax=Serendipita vermifera MAFF 305830 TaxID=933852 RepID=A0A0C2XNC0_SERVB|nr:hypothetical protein M408DRAFT_328069 [Serendipita vermifera MAFF 305830]
MPVTFTVAGHPAQSIPLTPAISSAQAFAADIRMRVDRRLPQRHADGTRLLSTCLSGSLEQINPSKNGFVDACITAYSQHHHLEIRPDDVWAAIITQFSFYVNAHAEELRDSFVPTQKRKKLKVAVNGNAWTADYTWITKAFVGTMKDNLQDKELASWILPKFTTTTKVDALCASVLMMGTLQAYFAYDVMPLCGIPTVTLKGEKKDYINILQRIDKLSSFGEETHWWAGMLRPIIQRFASAFDGEPDEQFWNQICHHTIERCGDEHYTGWITAFCPFDERGKWQLFTPWVPEHIGHLHIDGVNYQALSVYKIPWGFAQVDIKIIECGIPIEATFVAGLMGVKISDGPKSNSRSSLGLFQHDVNTSISPLPAWFIYEATPIIPPPKALVPGQLQNLHQFLHTMEMDRSLITSGVPLLHSSAPIDFASMFEEPVQVPKPEVRTRFIEPSGTMSSPGSEPREPREQREGPRKLRKERPWPPPEENTLGPPIKEAKSWFSTRRRLPLMSANTH